MASAAKSINLAPVGVEPGQAPVPGAAEKFAAMIAGAGGDETSGEGAMPEAAPEEGAEAPETQIDASVLLPMLDQQRAAAPAAKLVAPPVDTATPEKVKVTAAKAGGENPVPITPAPKHVNVAPVDASDPASAKLTDPVPVIQAIAFGEAGADETADPTPVMRPLADGKTNPPPIADKVPVMRTIDGNKPVPGKPADPAPVMRVIDGGKSASAATADKAPVMRPIEGGKPATAKTGDPTPVMRPIDASTPAAKTPPPASPAALEAPQPDVPQVATTPPAPAQAKTAETKVATPEMQIAAAEAQAAPVAAKARQERAAAPAATEIRTETATTTPGTTPVAATAAETRAAVQPLHASPSLVQPLAAPAGAPVQNVAAALSQQVLDMSGGDAWIDQIARDISQTAGKDGTMRFRLAPETLGDLKVEITHSERGAHVRLNVSSEAAQQALAAAEHKLTAEARAQGVRIAETEISFTGGQSRDASAQAHANAREQGQQQAQANQQSRTTRGTSANSFTSSAAAPEGRGRTDRYA